ncbi:MAG: PKD domain-containing protein [Bacteroidia bacterium]
MLFSVLIPAWGQNISMFNGTVSTCGGILYDSGTDTSDYSSNETYVLTFCSDVPGKCVSLNFTGFDLENNFDFLYVYNGPTATSPLLGTFTGNNSPGIITATSGCLTVKFVSDYTVNNAGWRAIINCGLCPVNGCPTCNGGVPPANDACAGAENLGALPVPAACPGGQGQPVIFNTTNICATAEIPYNALQNCDPVGNMAIPASDVWYKFTVTGPILNVTINGMITPEVGLYSGNSCNNLVPRGCAIGGGGFLNTSFSGLAPGLYYLRVSGGTLADQCNFNLTLQNNLDCQGCISQTTLTVNPLPQNGIYLAGTTVNFCLQISDFSPTSSNWLHAVIPTFGPGWDVTTLVAAPPQSCSGNGTWSWYNQQVTSSANGSSAGPGFFYETAAGNQNGIADNDPGNNFGDNFSNNCAWNFCFSIHTQNQANCINGANLNIFFDTYGDGETGAWTSVACSGDPVNDFFATLACCIPPGVMVTNPLCNGQTGSAIGTGYGNGPWTFKWKNSGGTVIRLANSTTTDQILNLGPGSYSLSTIDALGCETSVRFDLVSPQILSATVVAIDTKCALNNGKVTVNATGGTAPYLYSTNGITWQTSNIITNLAPGAYNIVVKDANGCLWGAVVNIAASTFPVISNLTSQNILCYNGTDGKINIVAGSGSPPYNYSVTNGQFYQSNPNFSNLPAGTYQVVVKDSKGCTAQATINLTQPPPIDLELIIINASCNVNDGNITMNVLSGGVGALTYSITNGLNFQTSNVFNNLYAGVYFVQVADSNGCLAYDTAIVNSMNPPAINSITVVDLTCYHSANGSLTINASGGVGQLQYSIDNGITFSTSNTFNNLTANLHVVIVKDQNNCRIHKLTTVYEPAQILVSAIYFSTTCGLNNGAMTFYVANGLGVPPYEYSIDNGTTWQSSGIFSNLPSGTVVVVARDVNGCTAVRVSQVGTSSIPVASALNITDISCNGSVTGFIDVTATGGIPPIKYSIDGGTTFSTVSSFTDLAAGNYNLRIKDNVDCTSDTTFVIAEPQPLVLTATSLDARCNLTNGSITMNVSGGISAYVYSIDGGLTFDSSNVFINLPSGNYKIVTMDANGCIEAATIIINDAPGPRITDTLTTPQICDGVANASVSITAVSGTGILEYSIDSGNTFYNDSVFQNIFSGTYYVYVRDANGCRDSLTVISGIYNSPVIDQVITANPSCAGLGNGSISINASGGNGLLLYSINGGTDLYTANNFDSLIAGTYYAAVTDTNNCLVVDTLAISQPAALAFSNVITPEKCNGNDGTIALYVSGGTQNYQFGLNNNAFVADSVFTSLDSGFYHVIIKDANGCLDSANVFVPFSPAPVINTISLADESCNASDNGSITINASGGSGVLSFSNDNGVTFQLSNTFDSLVTNNYMIIISDTNNCFIDSIVTITQPPAIIFNYQSDAANCSFSNGSIHVSAVGGIGPLTFSINNSGVFSSDTNFLNLASGNYVITVKDSMNCTEDFIASVSNLNGPVIQSVTSTDINCNGINTGFIIINANGGSGLLSFSIDNGLTFQSSNSFINLPAATYNIIIEDTAGCQATNSVEIRQPVPIVINHQVINAACGQSNGAITLVVTGGSTPYIYSIDSVNYQSSPQFSNLLAGSFMLSVKDSNECIKYYPVSINNLLAPLINSATQKNLTCYHNQTGEINITASDGTGMLNYSIDNGTTFQPSNVFNQLNAGTYNVVVQDQNNCIASSLLQLSEPDSLILNATFLNEICSNHNGSISVNATGGSTPYLFSGDSGLVYSSQTNYTSLNEGVYNIVVKDSNTCKVIQQVVITDLSAPQILNYVSADVNCFNGNDGSAIISAAGGNGILLYALDTNQLQQSNVFTNLSQGNYLISVMDTNGCKDTVHVIISQPVNLSAAASHVNTNCFGSPDGTATVVAAGGSPNYSIYWSNGAINNFALTGLISGTYYFTVTDQHLCTVNDSIKITQPQELLIIHTAINGSCAGSANASASVTVTGGTPGYSYAWAPVSSNTNYANNLTAGNYTVTVTDAHGCTKDHSIIITNPTPVVAQLQVTPVNCYGGNDGKIVVNTNGGNPPYSYSWNGMNLSSNTADSLAVGNYSVFITDMNGCTLEQTASVSSPSQINVSGSINNATCYGYANGSVNLAASGGVPPYLISWSNGTTQSAAGNLFAGNYSVTVSDVHNCTKQVSFLITEPTVVVVSVTPVDTLCIGQQTSLLCNASGGAGSYTYTWSTGQTLQAIQVAPIVSNSYTIQVTDTNGCLSNLDTSFVFVYPPLQISVSPNDTICQKETVTISAVPSGGNGGPYFYTWDPVNSTSQQINVRPDTTTTYMVSISDHCTVHSVAGYVTIKVNPLPLVGFAPVPSEGCQPLTVNFTDETITPLGSVYDWNLGDNSPHQNIPNPVHEYTVSGSYDVTLTVTTPEKCTDLLTLADAVSVFPLPEAAFTLDPKTASMFNPRITFTDESMLAVEWNWNFGDGTGVSALQNPVYIYGDTGTFTIRLIASTDHECRDTSSNEVQINGEFTFYVPDAFTPNADGKNDFFTPSGFNFKDYSILIFDRWGQKVFEGSGVNSEWNGKQNNSGPACPQGVYVYKIQTHDLKNRLKLYEGKVNLIR